MERKLSLYLHFARYEKLNSWEIKFTHSLGLIVQQLFGQSPLILCNCDIPDTTYCNPQDSRELLNSVAFLFIFNYSSNTELKDSELLMVNNVMDFLLQEQKDNIGIVHRYYKKKNTLADKFGKHVSFNFFELNAKTQEVIDFKSDSKEEKDNNYWLRITDLAYTIKSFADAEDLSKSSNIALRTKTIFLAEVSVDQLKTRERLRRDLQLSGYYVLPERPLSKDAGEFSKEVKSMLEQSILSINIIGELYGDSPTGSDYSYQELQNRYFSEIFNTQIAAGKKQPVVRIIWSPPLLEPYEEKQIQYLKRINRDINNSDNTTLVQSTLYDLISLIEQKAQFITTSQETAEERKNTILLISDNYRDSTTLQIQKELEQREIPFMLLNTINRIGGNDLSQLMQHIGKYKNNIIIATKPENVWLNSILTFLTRSRGYAFAAPYGKVGLFSMTNQKKYTDFSPLTIEPYIINNVNLAQQLDSFISKTEA